MADRIFPNKFQESGLDSELVFTGINWDAFGQRLAAMEEGEDSEKKSDVPAELMEALHRKYESHFDEIAEGAQEPVNAKWAAVETDEDDSEEDDYDDEDEEVACDFVILAVTSFMPRTG